MLPFNPPIKSPPCANAIDNALERLPNELNILPIRLVSSERKNKVDAFFLPNMVIDNFLQFFLLI